MCVRMIDLAITKDIEIVNEVLELYRFIAEKYASFSAVDGMGQTMSSWPLMHDLVKHLFSVWEHIA